VELYTPYANSRRGKVGDEGAVAAATSASMAGVSELELDGVGLTSAGIRALEGMFAAGKCPLRKLWARTNGVGDEGAAEAAKLLAVPDSAPPTAGVVTLDLTKNLIGEVGGLAIASALVGNCCLTELMLSQNPIGDETAKALALAIVGNEDSAVRRLNLSQCSLGDVGATALAEALETEGGTEFGTHINALYLGRNAISDVGAAQLADALEDSINLKELYLGGCKM
jgi:hypothetical protein